jgi:hypothetical protein
VWKKIVNKGEKEKGKKRKKKKENKPHETLKFQTNKDEHKTTHNTRQTQI